MADRNAIIDKIKALLAKTTENGATEAEMLAALDKAAAMQDAYGVSDADLQLTKEKKAILHPDPDATDTHGIKWRLSYAVGRFCNVEIFRRSHVPGLRMIGLPSDAEFAAWLLNALADFVFGELQAHLIGCLAPRRERRTIIRSFVDACCMRISDRMLELVKRSEAARTSNGRELILVKDAAIKAFMEEHRLRIRTCSGSGPNNINETAARAGHAAGDRAHFGRPVTGAVGALRIGRS
jgi:hypothetical protein